MPESVSRTTHELLARRQAFKAFVRSRVGNEADAEDLLQNSLIKALEHAGEIRDGEKTVAWFYQLLRRAIVDHVRSRRAVAQREQAWASDAATLVGDAAARAEICACFEKLLPSLKRDQAELLRRVELGDEPVAEAARSLGMTPNHASVTLHRARAELRRRLIDFCRDCACLDRCECT